MPSYGEDIQDYVEDEFKKKDITIMNKVSVKEIRRNEKDQTEVELSNGEVQQFGMMVWSTGVEPLPFIKELDCPHDPVGRILIDDKLQVANCPGVYAMGDNAVNENKFLPPVAQVADQQADYLAAKIFNEDKMEENGSPDFRYLHKGSMAQIGDGQAVLDIRGVLGDELPAAGNRGWEYNPKGQVEFVIWRTFYWTKSVSAANKLLIPMYWLKSKYLGRDVSRF